MSQMLTVRKNKVALYQDLEFSGKKSAILSSTNALKCHVCQHGLENGVSITAKNTRVGTLFLCDLHYPKTRLLTPKFR